MRSSSGDSPVIEPERARDGGGQRAVAELRLPAGTATTSAGAPTCRPKSAPPPPTAAICLRARRGPSAEPARWRGCGVVVVMPPLLLPVATSSGGAGCCAAAGEAAAADESRSSAMTSAAVDPRLGLPVLMLMVEIVGQKADGPCAGCC